MKTYIVTFAEGTWAPFGDCIVENFERISGLPVIRIRDEGKDHAHWFKWMKCCIWDHVPEDCDRVIWLDADIVLMKPFPFIPQGDFCGVLDWEGTIRNAEVEWPSIKIVEQYFNMGAFVISRKTQPLFEFMKKQSPVTEAQYGHLKDQNWINRELASDRWSDLQIEVLDREFNFLSKVWGPCPANTIALHFAGVSGSTWDRFALMRPIQVALGYDLQAQVGLDDSPEVGSLSA